MNSGLFSGLPCDGSMGEILLYYQRPQPATWVYLSSFLVMGLFFMFHRFWSMRNLDVALLLMLSPGLMMVYEGRKMRYEQSYKPTTQSAAADQTREVAEHSVTHTQVQAWGPGFSVLRWYWSQHWPSKTGRATHR